MVLHINYHQDNTVRQSHKVTLLAINAKFVHSSLAVWYLAEAVSQFSRLSHKIEVIESTINQSDNHILTQITKTSPDVLGISVYIWNAAKVEDLLKNIKANLPNTKIILGGPEVSYNAEHWLSQGAHFIIQGEGEHSFPMLLDTLAVGNYADLDMIPGLWRCVDEKTVFVQMAEPDNRLINPYSDKYWESLNGRIAYVETSRGCPFQCSFCLSGGSRLRFFPLDEAKNQLLRLSQSGSQTIKLVDRTFNCNADRAYELFEYVIGLDTQCCFHFEVAADLFDERTLCLLRTAPPGRIQLEAGLQSFYQATLDAVARKTDLQAAVRNLKTLLDAGNIHIHVDLIAGLPLETLTIFKESFNRAYAVGAHMLQVGFLKLLHGSALRKQAEQLNLCYSDEPPYEITSSAWLSSEDFEEIKLTEHALQRIYNSGRFIETVQYVLSASGISPYDLYYKLGKSSSGYYTPIGSYAKQIFDCFSTLPGVDTKALRDHMVCDWLCSMKGKNMPDFLQTSRIQTWQVTTYAEQLLGRKIARCEVALLQQGGIFIDSDEVNPVTGRCTMYKL